MPILQMTSPSVTFSDIIPQCADEREHQTTDSTTVQQQAPSHECPAGHRLTPSCAVSWYCDKCSARGSHWMTCRSCNYALCPVCYDKPTLVKSETSYEKQSTSALLGSEENGAGEECKQACCKYFMKSGFCVNGHTVPCLQTGCVEFMNHVPPNHIHISWIFPPVVQTRDGRYW